MSLFERISNSSATRLSMGLMPMLRCVGLLLLLCFTENAGGQEPAHPSLLFDKSDIQKLRESVKTGWMKDAFLLMESRAKEYLTVSTEPYKIDTGKSLGRRFNNRASTLALTGLITGERLYCDKAVAIVVSAANESDVDLFAARNGHLSVGDGAHAYAMAYDWLWEYMTDDQRSLIREEIRSFGKWLYADSMTGRGYGDYIPQNLSCNHNSVMHGGLGLCSLVLGEKPEWAERAQKYVRGYLQHSCDKTGYSFEGVGYFAYGTWGGIPFGVALKLAGRGDIFAGIKTLPMIPEYILRQTVPGERELVAMNDSIDRLGSSGGFMYLITKYQDRVGLWNWLKLYGREGDGSFGTHADGYLGDGASLPYTLLFADPNLEPESPESADLPLFKFFKSGRASFRSGWDELDAFATFTCGFDRHRGHNHRDENSFTFFARGERFAIDPGYHPNQTRAHNTVLIDGMGQTQDPGEYDVNGKMNSFRKEDSAWSVTGEAADAFPESLQVSRAKRQFLFVNAAVPYLVVADDIRTKLGLTEYTWLFHTDRNNDITIVPEKNTAYVKGSRRGAICKIQFIAPTDGLEISETDLKNETFERGGKSHRYARFFKEIRASYQAEKGRFITVISAADTVAGLPRVRSKLQSDDIWLEVALPNNRTDTIRVTPGRIIISKSDR